MSNGRPKPCGWDPARQLAQVAEGEWLGGGREDLRQGEEPQQFEQATPEKQR
jgi:hypothetical protein